MKQLLDNRRSLVMCGCSAQCFCSQNGEIQAHFPPICSAERRRGAALKAACVCNETQTGMTVRSSDSKVSTPDVVHPTRTSLYLGLRSSTGWSSVWRAQPTEGCAPPLCLKSAHNAAHAEKCDERERVLLPLHLHQKNDAWQKKNQQDEKES